MSATHITEKKPTKRLSNYARLLQTEKLDTASDSTDASAHRPMMRVSECRLKNHKDLSNLPDQAIIRLPDVLRLFPVCKSTWWQGVKTGIYPAPIKLGVRARGWRLCDVMALTQEDEVSASEGGEK